jgi:hypothetical protein
MMSFVDIIQPARIAHRATAQAAAFARARRLCLLILFELNLGHFAGLQLVLKLIRKVDWQILQRRKKVTRLKKRPFGSKKTLTRFIAALYCSHKIMQISVL